METQVSSDKLFHIATGPWKASCFCAALELGVFEVLKGGCRLDKDELAKRVGIDKFRVPEDYLDTLVAM
jgi:hypothetical protein